MADTQALLEKIQALPPERLGEVEDFVDFLAAKTRRLAAMNRLLAIAPALEAAGAPRIAEDEIAAEVDAVRTVGGPEAAVRIVLDTNVVLSALLWRGTPYRLLEAVQHREHVQLFSSTTLLEELAEVLIRSVAAKRLAIIGRTARQVLADYVDTVDLVTSLAVPSVVAADADDDHVVAAAIAAQADIIVSGDRHLLALGTHQAIRILTPAEALQTIIAQ